MAAQVSTGAFSKGQRLSAERPTAGLSPPVVEYDHGAGSREGNSVTGSYVYRGPVESLLGQYVFRDFVTGNI